MLNEMQDTTFQMQNRFRSWSKKFQSSRFPFKFQCGMMFGSVLARNAVVDLLKKGKVVSRLYTQHRLLVSRLTKGCSEVDELCLSFFAIDTLTR